MPPLPQEKPSTPPSSPAPCSCGRPSWALVADLALEVAAARMQLEQINEDEVQLIAPERFRIYRLLGGSTLTEAAFRAKTRVDLHAVGEAI